MKVVVTGASGLLGREIHRIFKESGHETVGTAFSRANQELHRLDLTDLEAVSDFIGKTRPELVVHAAAERKPDVCSEKPEQTANLNIEATKHLGVLSEQFGFQLIYISTDYVFDGTKPPYHVDDNPNPLNFYGKTKLAGEKKILEHPSSAVLRVPILYGPCDQLEEGAVTILAANLQKGIFEQENWATRYPTLTTDIAKVILDMAVYSRKQEQLTGIFHWSGDEAYTKYTMALTMAEIMGIDKSKVIPINEPGGTDPRPRDCHLDTSRLEELGICHRTPFADAIRDILTS